MADFVVFKDLGNGTIQCNVCSSVVKAKVWTAHVSGRKHRENVDGFKKAFQQKNQPKQNGPSGATSSAKTSLKRKPAEDTGANASAKRFADIGVASYSGPTVHMNSSSFNAETPWQAAQRAAGVVAEAKPVIFSKVEGVPVGFFDADRVKNLEQESMVTNQRQRNDRFDSAFGELPLMDTEKIEEGKENCEAERTAFLQSDIEFINEQIEGWKRINNLEKLKEEMMVRLLEKKHQEVIPPSDNKIARVASGNPSMHEVGSEGSDENEEGIFGQDSGWRIKNLI